MVLHLKAFKMQLGHTFKNSIEFPTEMKCSDHSSIHGRFMIREVRNNYIVSGMAFHLHEEHDGLLQIPFGKEMLT